MTHAEIAQWAERNGIDMTIGEIREAAESAECDADEGAEWLPFYKIALNRLSSCCGRLSAIIKADGVQIDEEEIDQIKRDWQLHLLFAGIGPGVGSAAEAAKVNAEAATVECFGWMGSNGQ
jgi:hypothetical protein